jgi:hypothetical protein
VIDQLAFEQCAVLTSIRFPRSWREIRGGGFHSCLNLRSVAFESESRRSIHPDAFAVSPELARGVLKNCFRKRKNRQSSIINLRPFRRAAGHDGIHTDRLTRNLRRPIDAAVQSFGILIPV